MKLDDAIAKVVKASEGLHVEKYTCVPEWQALLVATLGLLVAIAEWRKPPPGQGTAFDRLAAAMLDLRKRDEAIGEALRAWYGWLDAREAADAAPAPAEPLPVLAAAERLASGHVQRLTDGTWEWSPDGGFDRCVVPLGPEVSAFLSGIVKDAQETSARRPKSLREAFDSSSDEWDRLAAGRRRPADYAARRAQGETGHGMVLPEPEMAVIADEPEALYTEDEERRNATPPRAISAALAVLRWVCKMALPAPQWSFPDLPFTAADADAHNDSVRRNGRCALPACKLCKGQP